MDEPGPSITDSRGIIKQQKALGIMTCVLIFGADWCHLFYFPTNKGRQYLPIFVTRSLKVRDYRTLMKVLTTSISCADWKASYMFPWKKDKSLSPSRSINQASEFHCSCPGSCKVHLLSPSMRSYRERNGES